MTVVCPTCRRSTPVEAEPGGFPPRCQRCGHLLKPEVERDPALPPHVRRIERGALAGLLLSRSEVPPPNPSASPEDAGELYPRVIRGYRSGESPEPPPPAPEEAPPITPTILPELKKELSHARARSTALSRALLLASYQCMGALTTLGWMLVTFCSLSAVTLKVQASPLPTPRASHSRPAPVSDLPSPPIPSSTLGRPEPLPK